MITKYQCEICHREYNNKPEAIACEAQGKMPQLFPIGMIFGRDALHEKKNEHMIFAVAGFNQTDHYGTYLAWGARDFRAGDNLPDSKEEIKNPRNTCGFTIYRIDEASLSHFLKYEMKEPNQKVPAFERMVKALKKYGVQPKVLKGGEAIEI